MGRDRSPNPIRERESSVERRARIEQWNREKEVEDSGTRDNQSNNDYEEASLKNGGESGNHQI